MQTIIQLHRPTVGMALKIARSHALAPPPHLVSILCEPSVDGRESILNAHVRVAGEREVYYSINHLQNTLVLH